MAQSLIFHCERSSVKYAATLMFRRTKLHHLLLCQSLQLHSYASVRCNTPAVSCKIPVDSLICCIFVITADVPVFYGQPLRAGVTTSGSRSFGWTKREHNLSLLVPCTWVAVKSGEHGCMISDQTQIQLKKLTFVFLPSQFCSMSNV